MSLEVTFPIIQIDGSLSILLLGAEEGRPWKGGCNFVALQKSFTTPIFFFLPFFYPII